MVNDKANKVKKETEKEPNELFPKGLTYDEKIKVLIKVLPEKVKTEMKNIAKKYPEDDLGVLMAEAVKEAVDRNFNKLSK